ncbi:hypothetical protein [Tabrizicola sp.]|uniref:hypothetical protein n=1 Tax=Tabrizicola sp. TaxID=2005166 RepID=UPI003F352AAC
MPLFLKALPLSFQTFWRYLIILPVLAVPCLAVYVATFFIPILNLVVQATLINLCIMAGLRTALGARGHYTDLDIGKLVRGSLAFVFLGVVVSILIWVVVLVFVPLVTLPDSPYEITEENYSAVALILVVPFLYSLFNLAVAVPMTASAYTATPRAAQTHVFWGFGQGMFSLLVVSLAWLFILGTFIVWGYGETLIASGLQYAFGTASFSFGDKILTVRADLYESIGGLLVVIWATCWYFATSVLAWERLRNKLEAERATRLEVTRTSIEDLRALRESRMPGDPGGM